MTREERREKPSLGARTKTSCECTVGERTEIDLEPKKQHTERIKPIDKNSKLYLI
jgi:hypothetical protein